MSSRLFFSTIVGWPLVVLSVLGIRTAFLSPSLSPLELAGWLFACAAPVAIVMMLARGQSSATVTQVLYDLEHDADGTRKATTRDRR